LRRTLALPRGGGGADLASSGLKRSVDKGF
jgi:hypothetical protein